MTLEYHCQEWGFTQLSRLNQSQACDYMGFPLFRTFGGGVVGGRDGEALAHEVTDNLYMHISLNIVKLLILKLTNLSTKKEKYFKSTKYDLGQLIYPYYNVPTNMTLCIDLLSCRRVC